MTMTTKPAVFNKKYYAPPHAVYVGRGSPWGNPFIIGEHGTRAEVLSKFKCEVLPDLDLEELVGRDLVCWCWPKACHANLIIEEVERRYGEQNG